MNVSFHAEKCEDGSILMEWVHAEWRFGVSLETPLRGSSWFFVQKEPYITEGGEFSPEVLEKIRDYIMKELT